MARSRRGHDEPRTDGPTDTAPTGGTGGFAGQIGLFETGNGLTVGPIEILLALLAAVLIYPITRIIGIVRRR